MNMAQASMEDLIEDLGVCPLPDAHNAEADVTSLGQLLVHAPLPNSEIVSFSFSSSAVANSIIFNHQKSLNVRSLAFSSVWNLQTTNS